MLVSTELFRWRIGLALLSTVCVLLTVPLLHAQRMPLPSPQAAFERLDSLETAALTAGTFSERLSAVSSITRIGLWSAGCDAPGEVAAPRYRGLVARLRAVYRQTSDANLQQAILGQMLWHRECDEAALFLAEVAQEEAPSSGAPQYLHELRGSSPAMAVAVLAQLGAAGESKLRQLDAANRVHDPEARRALAELVRRNCRPPRR